MTPSICDSTKHITPENTSRDWTPVRNALNLMIFYFKQLFESIVFHFTNSIDLHPTPVRHATKGQLQTFRKKKTFILVFDFSESRLGRGNPQYVQGYISISIMSCALVDHMIVTGNSETQGRETCGWAPPPPRVCLGTDVGLKLLIDLPCWDRLRAMLPNWRKMKLVFPLLHWLGVRCFSLNVRTRRPRIALKVSPGLETKPRQYSDEHPATLFYMGCKFHRKEK